MKEPLDRAELDKRLRAIKKTLCCPYCLDPLTKYEVPQTPFTQWDNEYMYVCFNDGCPYYVRSWRTMENQGNRGLSYRLMYNPEKDRCMATPVPSPTDERTSIRG